MTSDMATGTRARKTTTAKRKDKDLVSRLADVGEEALHRLSELPGGTRVLNAVNDLRSRVDELTSKVRNVEKLEERVTKLEKEVAALKRSKPTARATGSSSRRSSSSSSSRTS